MDKRIVFGIADPADYMEPLCYCGHMRSDHYNGQGTPEPPDPCWHGWTDRTEGCQCEWFDAQRRLFPEQDRQVAP